MTEWLDFGLQWSGQSSGQWLALAIPPILCYAYWAYSNTLPSPRRRTKWLLWSLRVLALVTCILLLTEPSLDLGHKRVIRPILVTLIDASPSMSVTVDGSSRLDKILQLLRGDALVSLRRHMEGAIWSFADTASRVDLESLPDITGGEATDLTAALRTALSGVGERANLQGVLLLSDGAHNIGGDPVRIAELAGVPIHTVGVGSLEGHPPDLLIDRVEASDAVFLGQPFTVRVGVTSWALDQRVTVRVLEDSYELAHKQLDLRADGQSQIVEMQVTPKQPGARVFEVVLPDLVGEFSRLNNRVLLPVTVHNDRVRVEIVAGRPSPEVTFLQRSLSSDSTLSVNSCVFRGEGDCYESGGHHRGRSGRIAAADVVVLVDPDLEMTEQSLGLAIGEVVAEGAGLIVLMGSSGLQSWNPQSRLAGWVPIEAPPRAGFTPKSVSLRVTRAGARHPVLRSREFPVARDQSSDDGTAASHETSAEESWQRLPPLSGHISRGHSLPGSEVLIESTTGLPMVIAGSYQGGRTVAAVGTGFWRLDLTSSGAGEDPHTVRRFWRNTVKWLAMDAVSSRVRATPDRLVYRGGEEVGLHVEVFDELLRPLTGAEATARIPGHPPLRLKPLGAGRYQGRWQRLGEGSHAFTVDVRFEGRPVGHDEGTFVIDRHTVESSDIRPRHQLLREIAEASGGKFWTPAESEELARLLDAPPRIVSDSREIRLWGQYWVLPLLILSLTVEWVIRKRSGML